jgi:hypothetical protein
MWRHEVVVVRWWSHAAAQGGGGEVVVTCCHAQVCFIKMLELSSLSAHFMFSEFLYAHYATYDGMNSGITPMYF